jgi:zinc protease
MSALVYATRVRAAHFGFESEVKPDATLFTARAASIYVDDLVKAIPVMADEFRVGLSAYDLRELLKELMMRRSLRKASSLSSGLGRAVFGDDHPYATALDPLAAAHGKFSQGDLEDFAARHFVAANATLVIAGVFDAAALEERIRATLGELPRGKPTPKIAAPPRREGQPVVWSIPGKDDEPLVEVRVAWAVPAGIGEGYAARLVLHQMLERRVAAVRERLGASYGLWTRYEPTVGPAILAIVGAVDAARAGQALAVARTAIDELRRGEAFLDDFVRARAAVVSRLVGEANDSGSLAARLTDGELHGVLPDHGDRLAQEVARLSPRDVLALARVELDPAAEVIVAEGPRAALDKMYADAKIAAKIVAAK